MRTLGLVALAALSLGCTRHLRRNAPGHVDPRSPPVELAREEVEPPGDPGERLLLVSVGPFGAAGVGLGEADGNATFAGELGLEAGVHYGEEATSHEVVGFPFLPHTLPSCSWGVNAGVSFLDAKEDLAIGRLYGEISRQRRTLGFAAGYGYDPSDDTHGPHIMAFAAGSYLKVTYHFDRGADIVLGLVVKVPTLFVWSR